MSKPITADDLPPHLARFAEAEIAAGHFASVEDVVEAGLEALKQRTEGEHLEALRSDAAEAFAAFDRGEGVPMTPDELMDGIERDLGLRS